MQPAKEHLLYFIDYQQYRCIHIIPEGFTEIDGNSAKTRLVLLGAEINIFFRPRETS